VIRSRHPFVAFALALLIVGVQYGAQLHALEHLSEELKRTPDRSFTTPPDSELCAICALFAGGANAVASETDQARFAIATEANPHFAPASIATPAPSYYSSRAPPTFL
jgi:hypothetical protein